MSGFLYFLPGERVYGKHMLAEYGLAHIVDATGHVHSQQVVRGPENQPGLLLGARASWADGEVKWSDRLKWRAFPKPHAAKQAMCCWLDDMPMPGPNDLARDKQLTGEVLTLADGSGWLVPNARRWLDDETYVSTVPKIIGVDVETGDYIARGVAEQYRELHEHSEAYFSAYMAAAVQASADGTASIVVEDPVGFMFAAVAANYRISATELDVLGAIDETMFQSFVSVVMDRKSIEPIQKKTESDTTSI